MTSISFAKVVATVFYNGKNYFVDVQISGSSASVWFRVNQNSCGTGDFQVMNLSASNPTLVSAGTAICRAKKVYDNSKTIAGCLAIAASGICAAAAVPSGGATAALCSATFSYTVNKGLADCISGVSGKIANYLGVTPWVAYATKAGLSAAKWETVINTAIDNACKDVK